MRSLWVWFFGIGMGIPGIIFLPLILNFRTLMDAKSLPFDKKNGFIVEHCRHTVYKIILIAVFYGFIISEIINTVPADQEHTPLTNELAYSANAEYLNQLGYSLMEKGEYLQAKEMFLKGLEKSRSFATKDTLLNNLSWACYCLGEYEDALNYIRLGLELYDNSSIEYTNYANALYALGNISEAGNAYRTAINIDNNASALYGLGMIKYNDGCYEEAISLFEKYTFSEQNDPDGWCYLGLSHLYNNNNTAKAKECLDKAFKISSNDIFVISSLCEYYSYIGEYKEAEDLFLTALEENPDDYDLLCKIASFYNNEWKHDKAIEFADRAIGCNKENYNAYSVKAESLFALGKTEEAIDTINTMLASNSQDANIYYVAGDLYYNAYKYKDAIDYFNKALVLNPLHENAILRKICSLFYSKRYTACLNFALN